MRTRITFAMFALCWGMLILQWSGKANDAAMSQLTLHVSRNTQRIDSFNGSLPFELVNSYKGHNEETFYGHSYLRRMNDVRIRCKYVYQLIDSTIAQIAAEAGGYENFSLLRLRKPHDGSWRKKIYPRFEDLEHFLQAIDTLNEMLIRSIDPNSELRWEIRRILPSKWCEDAWSKQAPCRGEFATSLYLSKTAEAIGMLTGLKQQAAFSEQMILAYLLSSGRLRVCYDFSALAGLAIPDNSFVLPGQALRARIFIAGYDKTKQMQLKCSEGQVANQQYGIATWRNKAKGAGRHYVCGTAKIAADTGEQTIPWAFSYFVGPAFAFMQFRYGIAYRYVDNPINVHLAEGIKPESVTLSMPGATITKGVTPLQFSIRISDQRASRLCAYVLYHHDDGTDTIGSSVINVRNLPAPIAMIGGLTTGSISRQQLIGTLPLHAEQRDDLPRTHYKIIDCFVSTLYRRIDTVSEPVRLSNENLDTEPLVLKFVADASPGDKLIISDIRATTSDGRIVFPASIILTLQ